MSEKNVPNRRYTEQLQEATRLANSVGHKEAARRLGVPVATIENWARLQLKQGAASAAEVAVPAPRTEPAVSELEAENSRLRKELASAKLDIEIRSKATAYFAKGSRSCITPRWVLPFRRASGEGFRNVLPLRGSYRRDPEIECLRFNEFAHMAPHNFA